eukprot:gene6277-10284_t
MKFKKKQKPEEKFTLSKEILKKFLYQQSYSSLNISSTDLANIKDLITEMQSKYNLQKLLKENEEFVKSEIKSTEENSRVQQLTSNSEERMKEILDSMFDNVLYSIKENMNDSFIRFKNDCRFETCRRILNAEKFKDLLNTDDLIEEVDDVIDDDDSKSNKSETKSNGFLERVVSGLKRKSWKRSSKSIEDKRSRGNTKSLPTSPRNSSFETQSLRYFKLDSDNDLRQN